MIWLASQLRKDFRAWDRPTQIGFGVAVILLAGIVMAFFAVPAEMRQTVCFGAAALFAVIEALVMWGNRHMVTPITRAQRAYLHNDFEGALAELEPLRRDGTADYRTLTLLGNTYRQIGRLDESAAVLSEALDKSTDHHYSLYGYGRTLIVQGRYAEGASLIERALTNGAPPVVKLDLAEAYYREGRANEARAMLDQSSAGDEPHRMLMSAFWRAQLGLGLKPEAALIRAGLPYWEAQAERFAQTPYGAAVALEVAQLQALLKQEVVNGSNAGT